jgi:hypothetical protein
MKKLIILLFLLTASISFAQIESFDSTYVKGLKEDLKTTVNEIVKENMKLTEGEAKVFWPLFEKYLSNYDSIFNQKLAITKEYMMEYYGLDNEKAKELINKSVKLNEDIFALKKKYMNLMFEQLPAKVVGKFFQIDARVSALVDLVRMSSVPLVRTEE